MIDPKSRFIGAVRQYLDHFEELPPALQPIKDALNAYDDQDKEETNDKD